MRLILNKKHEEDLATRYGEVIHQVMAQSSLFLCGTIYEDLVKFQNREFALVPAALAKKGSSLIQEHLTYILDYANKNKDKANRSWPVLLKSTTFFTFITAHISGIRKGKQQ